MAPVKKQDQPVDISAVKDDDQYDLPAPVNRRDARIRVMQTLYATAISERVGETNVDELSSNILGVQLSSRPDLLEFAQLLMMRTWNGREECDALIERLATNWDVSRITPIDMAVLRMGLGELLHFPDIPARVTINEAIEIAKRFSTDKSGVFINGMLDAAATLLKKEGRLKKSGRGLIE